MHKLAGIKFLIALFLLTSALHALELDWLHDYNQALTQAKQEKKNIYLFIGADVCRFCDRFKELTLSDKSVLKRLREEYVLLYLSRDQHAIPSRFKTKGVPIHYFLKPDGSIIFETWGGYEVEGFHLILDEAELNQERE